MVIPLVSKEKVESYAKKQERQKRLAREMLAKEKGFKTYANYLEYLAKKKVKDELAKEKGSNDQVIKSSKVILTAQRK